MNLVKQSSLSRVIFVAARPPIPPFSGSTLKLRDGIDALTSVTEVQVVTFAPDAERGKVAAEFKDFWKGRPVRLRLVAYGKRAHALEAALTGRFQFGTMLERSALPNILAELEWAHPRHLVFFDDIVFAPFAPHYGRNAILSPHDCISEMHWSHFRLSPVGLVALKHYFQHRIALCYERRFYHFALLIHVVTHRDRIWLERINPKARYHVLPIASLTNPSLGKSPDCPWDVMIWANLNLAPLARSVREVLRLASQDLTWLRHSKVIVVGRVPIEEAEKVIGKRLLSLIDYAPYLESADGSLKQPKITLIPDLGGVGIKTRCVATLASGQCLACLYPQMAGLEKACDRGAINAVSLEELLVKIKAALRTNSYRQIGDMGEAIFRQNYSSEMIRQGWLEMIQRALAIRDWSTSGLMVT